MAASSSSSPGSDAAADDDEGRLGIGSVLDSRYRIDALIGTGGMGRVYRGEHTGIGRAVAIKVLHQDLNRNREAAQRFQREAIAYGRLDHPNIVNIYDFGVLPDGACYLVMELLEGETLGARLERDVRLPWREALDILRGVLLGLRHAHDRGVVHRDIKPDNIYLAVKDGDLIIKLLDFGIAKLRAGTTDDPASTRAGLTVGTPTYLSPEQAVGGEITPASDLYSATVLLFEMLAGRSPFEELAKDPLAMLGAHVSRPPPSLSAVAPDVELPAGLESVIAAGLVKVAAERIRSAKEYIGQIDSVLTAARRYRTGPVVTPSVPALAAPGAELDGSGASAGEPTPGSATQALPVTGTLSELPQAARAVSIAEAGEMIPRRWLVIGGIVIVLLIIGAVLLTVLSDGNYKPATSAGTGDATAERDLKLKALLDKLQNGKTCAARKAAIAPLIELGDPRAIEPLRAARYRPAGGRGGGGGGSGADNINACLVPDAEAAIKALSS